MERTYPAENGPVSPSNAASESGSDAPEAKDAIRSLQLLCARYGAMETLSDDDRARYTGAACELGELLARQNRLPEAISALQEAIDAMAGAAGNEAPTKRTAQRITELIRALGRDPQHRLYLLIARHERDQRRLAVQSGTENAQADCAFRIATIFQRRDRFAEAELRYRDALALYEDSADTAVRRAEVHRRLAGLYHHELPDRARAIQHYGIAIDLYTAFEPCTDGEQSGRVLCEQLLRGLLAAG